MVIGLERGGNDLHTVQLMPLPRPSGNPECFILLVPAYSGFLGKRPLNDCVCVVSIDNVRLDEIQVM